MRLQKTAEGIILELHVKPYSKEFKIKTEEDGLVISCRESPVKGRVNRELIHELSRLFKRRVEIISGFGSRQKRILIRDIKMNEARQLLDSTKL